jgi:hypothetical protein
MADYSKEELERLESAVRAKQEAVELNKEDLETKRKLAEIEKERLETQKEIDKLQTKFYEDQDNYSQADEKRNKQLDKRIKDLNKEKQETEKITEAYQKNRKELRESKKELQEIIELRKKNNAEIEEEIAKLEEHKEQLKDNNETIGDKIALQKTESDLIRAQILLLEKQGKARDKEKEKALKASQQEVKRLEEIEDLLGDVDKQASIAQESITGIFSSLLRGDAAGAAKNIEKLNGLFTKLKANGASTGAVVKSLAGSLTSLLAPIAAGALTAAPGLALIKITKAALDLAVQLSDLEKSVMKATGGSQEFASVMTKSFAETRKFAGTAEEAAKAQIALSQTFTDFTMLGASTQQQLVQTSALLERLGVDAAATAKNTQLMVKSLGMTAEQAGEANLRLAALGQDLGMDPAKLAQDFGSAGGQLAKLGSNGEAAFKRLAVASKATGLEIGKILNMVEKFDTFEGAATQAGKLNAALGGNFVNAMELMTATDPVERFNMIRDSILDAGLSFDEMSYYQRKFYTEAAGLSDVSELAMMMSGNMDALSGDVGKTSADYAEMAERAREMATFQETLNAAFQQLIPVLTPVVKKVTEFTKGFLEAMIEYGPMIIKTLQVIGVLAGVVGVALAVAFGGLSAPIWAIAAAIGGIISAVTAIATLMFDTPFNPPSFFQGMKEMSEDFDGMSVNINKSTKTMHSFGNEVVATGNKTYRQTQLTKKAMPEVMQMTNTSMTNEINKNQINNAMLGASTATTNAVSNAVKNSTSNTTINNNGQGGGETGISIKFDNKKFADLFDVQVEKSIGRAARKAVI